MLKALEHGQGGFRGPKHASGVQVRFGLISQADVAQHLVFLGPQVSYKIN